MISKSHLERVEREWRRFALGPGAHLLFWPGIGTFLLAIVAPAGVSPILINRVCLSLFSALAFLMGSSFALTALVEFRRGERVVGTWMAFWAALVCSLGGVVGMSVVR
jgi:hypothetical protein